MFKKKKTLHWSSEDMKLIIYNVCFLQRIKIICNFSSLLIVPENKYLINVQPKLYLG